CERGRLVANASTGWATGSWYAPRSRLRRTGRWPRSQDRQDVAGHRRRSPLAGKDLRTMPAHRFRVTRGSARSLAQMGWLGNLGRLTRVAPPAGVLFGVTATPSIA